MTVDLTTLRGLPLFANLDEPLLFSLGDAVERAYARGQVIVRAHEPAQFLYVVLSGGVRESQVTPEGKDVILALHGPGELFGEVALFDGEQMRTDASALVASRILHVPKEDLIRLTEQHPQLARAMASRLSRRCRDAWAMVRMLSRYTTEARLKSALLILAEQWGQPREPGIEIAIDLTHRMLADLVGASREKVTRAMGLLQKRELLTMTRRRIFLPSLDRLVNE